MAGVLAANTIPTLARNPRSTTQQSTLSIWGTCPWDSQVKYNSGQPLWPAQTPYGGYWQPPLAGYSQIPRNNWQNTGFGQMRFHNPFLKRLSPSAPAPDAQGKGPVTRQAGNGAAGPSSDAPPLGQTPAPDDRASKAITARKFAAQQALFIASGRRL